MKHLSIIIKDLPPEALMEVESTLYDQPYQFTNKEGTLSIRATHVHSGTTHIPQFVLLPWGWTLEVPVIRTYNLYLQKHYHADIYFYELRELGMKDVDKNMPVLEQFARRWLEAHIDQGLIVPGKPVIITGPSLGGYISTIINSIAHEYGVVVGNIYAWEPGGMTPKKISDVLDQVSNDTQVDYEASYGNKAKVSQEKIKLMIATLKIGFPLIKRCAQEIASGNLADYINTYLKTQDGIVNIGHGADSSFVTFADLDYLDAQISDPNRVIAHDYAGYKHGLGYRALGMANYFSKYTADNQ